MIIVISGTNRKGSMTMQVSALCKELLIKKEQEVKLLNLCDLPHDFLFTALYENKNAEFEKIVEENIYASKKIIFVSPEYNGGFSGILKGFIDGWNPKRLSGQKVALVGVATGRSGNLRGLDYLANICNYMKLPVLPEKVPISRVSELGNNDKGIHDTLTIQNLDRVLADFVKF